MANGFDAVVRWFLHASEHDVLGHMTSENAAMFRTFILLKVIQSEPLQITIVLGCNFRNITLTLRKDCHGNAAADGIQKWTGPW